MELWTEAIAFVQEPGPDALYELLRPIGYSRVEIERLEDRARYFAQRFPCDPKRGIAPVALTELTEVLNELLGLIEEETRLSSLPPPRLEPPKPGASLLDQATSDYQKWLNKPHDYALPEKDPDFSRRKRRAVERLFHLHEKASAEALTTATAVRLGKETWFMTQDAKTGADSAHASTRTRDATPSVADDLLHDAPDREGQDLKDRANCSVSIPEPRAGVPAPLPSSHQTPEAQVRDSAPTPTGQPARIEGKDAAVMIGIGAPTLSRWRSKVPKWASSNTRQFIHLLERDPDSRYYRDRIITLAAWFRKSQENAGQTPVECP